MLGFLTVWTQNPYTQIMYKFIAKYCKKCPRNGQCTSKNDGNNAQKRDKTGINQGTKLSQCQCL